MFMPYGFWRRHVQEEMRLEYTKRKREMLWRALLYYVQRRESGAKTHVAMLGMRDANSYRADGGSMNSRKAAGLGSAWLQFFADDVQRLKCRADSEMLMRKARELRGCYVIRAGPTQTYLSLSVTRALSGSGGGGRCLAF